VIALTHADHDHLDGLYAVLDNFRVGALWIGEDDPRPAFKRLLAEAKSRGVTIVHQAQGAESNWHGALVDVLWPPNNSFAEKKANDNSLVLRLSDGHIHFLLTGDIEQHAEEKLVEEGMPLAADFLKVSHHGSKTSSTPAFLEAVAPQTAAVSVGQANPFNHPAETVVDRYETDGIKLLRTDRDGAIAAITDGQTISVHDCAGAAQ
jgi:competence protein ComEC